MSVPLGDRDTTAVRPSSGRKGSKRQRSGVEYLADLTRSSAAGGHAQPPPLRQQQQQAQAPRLTGNPRISPEPISAPATPENPKDVERRRPGLTLREKRFRQVLPITARVLERGRKVAHKPAKKSKPEQRRAERRSNASWWRMTSGDWEVEEAAARARWGGPPWDVGVDLGFGLPAHEPGAIPAAFLSQFESPLTYLACPPIGNAAPQGPLGEGIRGGIDTTVVSHDRPTHLSGGASALCDVARERSRGCGSKLDQSDVAEVL